MRKIIGCLFLISGLGLYGQEADTTEMIFRLSRAFGETNRPYLELKTIQGGASRDWSTNQIYQFFFSNFVDDDEKAAMLDRGSDGLRLGSEQSWEFRFVYRGHQKSKFLPLADRSFYFFNRSYSVLGVSSDLLRLGLYGNRSTAGEIQDIGDMQSQSWFYSGVGHQTTFLIDTIPVSLGISLVTMHSLSRYEFGDATLLTQPDGSSLDFDGQYDFSQTTANTSYTITGWGLAISLETAERRGPHEIALGLKDLGMAYMDDWERVERDSSFSFTGLDLGSVLSLDEESFNGLLDSLQDGLLGSNRSERLQLLPFSLQLNYRYNFNKKEYAYLESQYLYLPTYIPRVATGYGYKWKNFEARSGLAYGGFNGLSWDAGASWKLNSHFRLQGGLSNLFGLALPMWSGGTLGNFSVRYYF